MLVEQAHETLKGELYASLIRAQTDPIAVRAEALALDRMKVKLLRLLTEVTS